MTEGKLTRAEWLWRVSVAAVIALLVLSTVDRMNELKAANYTVYLLVSIVLNVAVVVLVARGRTRKGNH